ncbi:MAG: magnesium transporter [Deltaproteobacteria bacterium]|nr:magnesium transporter [Deltaproteobacteria bacterium]
MKNPFLAPELREIVEKNDDNALQAFCAFLHPASVADFLGALSSQEIWHVLVLLEPRLRAEIFGALDQDLQGELIESLNRQDLAQIVNHMSADERVDLLKRMPDDRQETLMPVLAQAEREDIRRLSSYPEGTAGAAMTSDYATLPPDQTVREALSKLRREAPDKETIYYSYVLDPDRRLIGFLSLKDLIIARPDRRIEELMHRDLIYAVVSDDQEDAARKIAKYDLIALPVVNGNRELVGIITHDDAIDIINQEHTEDMEKFMAIAGSHETGAYLRTSSWGHFKNRCIWLVALAALGLVSGYIVQSFEGLLLQFAILATFMPMLADTGGNTGSQSATLIVRALAVREISPGDILRVLWKEFKVGLPMAFLLAGLAFGRVIFFAGGSSRPEGYSLLIIGLAVGAALGLQVLTSTLIGALLPLAAAKMKFDPAVVASPALTTIVDITGLFIYFTTAKLLLGI